MGWFNVLKGAYPSLQQIDKTLPVKTGETGIVRGSMIYEDAGSFVLAQAADNAATAKYIYFCLVGQDDLTAGMAGTVGQGVAGGLATITGLAVGMPMEFETDQFVAGSYTAGQLLMGTDDGKLTAHTDDKNVVAQVTKPAATRWVNDAIAVTGFRTGANVSVLTARTVWLPTFSTA